MCALSFKTGLYLGWGHEAPCCMNDHDNECWYEKSEYSPIMLWGFFFVNWLQNKKNLHDLVDCVHALQFNAPGRLSQVNPGVQKISSHHLVVLLFSTLPPPHTHFFSFPKLLVLIWPVIWILPGLVSPTTSLPGRIGPITPQPQPDQSSLSPRERRSKRRFDEQPPLPLLSPGGEPRPRWKTWIAGPWHCALLSDRPLIPRLSCSHPISSVY